jgi:hypothetical protein
MNSSHSGARLALPRYCSLDQRIFAPRPGLSSSKATVSAYTESDSMVEAKYTLPRVPRWFHAIPARRRQTNALPNSDATSTT